jgi:hypothetical protein
VEKVQRAAFPVILVYLWTMMILLGAIVLETFMVYPNIFHDPPRTLELAMEFLAVRGPADFFPPLGFLLWVAGAAALVLGWRARPARWWILLSLMMIVADGLVSILFFWPRNEIMFVEGSAVHSAEVLRQTARESRPCTGRGWRSTPRARRSPSSASSRSTGSDFSLSRCPSPRCLAPGR